MDDKTNKIVNFLSSESAFEADSNQPEVIETHISYVFLGKMFVYKFKKPLKLDFLDFSTKEARKTACDDELTLNRRLAEDVYLDVLPIFEDIDGNISLKKGSVVDYVVKMRRLPQELFLHTQIEDHCVSSDDVINLSKRLNRFYENLHPIKIKTAAYLEGFSEKIGDNAQELLKLAPEKKGPIKASHSAQLIYLIRNKDAFQTRIDKQKIVEGHGDLRPEHVCFEQPPKVIDCIEFNRNFRVVDILDELAFFSEECEFLGRPDIGHKVLTEYCAYFNETYPPALLNFYKSYRASVRAKVAALKRSQDHNDTTSETDLQKHVEMAAKYAAKINHRSIFIIGGLMGTGKSTLTHRLKDHLCLDAIHTDLVRKELFENHGSGEYGSGTYSAANRDRVYEACLQRAQAALQNNQSIIVDGTFLNKEHRHSFYELAQSQNCHFLFAYCHCPKNISIKRLENRKNPHGSEAHSGLYDEQKSSADMSFSGMPHVEIDTTWSKDAQLSKLIEKFGEDPKATAATNAVRHEVTNVNNLDA